MVAYSFQRRFAQPIRDNIKLQTIRADRRRHARPGERLQLFTGMRTVHCEKICEDRLCLAVVPLLIDFDPVGLITKVTQDGHQVDDIDAFAIADGFECLADMSGFWVMQHGLSRRFDGVLVTWASGDWWYK